jgi:translocation and assembly module TamB
VAIGGITADRLTASVAPAPEGAAAPLRLTGTADGLVAVPGSAPRDLAFSLAGALPDGTPELRSADIDLGDARLAFTGTATAQRIEGHATLEVPDLGQLADLTGANLRGSLALGADLAGTPDALTARLDGAAQNLVTGVAEVDTLLGDRTTLAGAVETGPGGIAFHDLALAGASGAGLTGEGRIGGGADDRLALGFNLPDLATLVPDLSGPAAGTLAITGGFSAPQIALAAKMEEGRIAGQPAQNVTVSYKGGFAEGALDGDAAVSGTIASLPVAVSGHLAGPPATLVVNELTAKVASATAEGVLALSGAGLPSGHLEVSVPEIGALTAPFGLDMAGALTGTVSLPEGGAGPAGVEARVTGLAVAGVTVGSLNIANGSLDPATLAWTAEVDAAEIDAAGTPIPSLYGTLSGDAGTAGGDVRLAIAGGEATATGSVAFGTSPLAINLSALAFTLSGETLSLTAPTEITIGDSGVAIADLSLATSAGGSAVVNGTVGQRLDLTARVDRLPLGLAALVNPSLSLGGTVSGTVTLDGTPSAPSASYDIAADGFSFAGAQAAVSGLDITARGTLTPETLTATGGIAGPDGNTGSFDVAGTVSDGSVTLGSVKADYAGNRLGFEGTARADALDGTVTLDVPDLSALTPLVGQPLAGTANLTARLTGDPSAGRLAATVEGTADNLALGIDALDGLLAGRTTISGSVGLDGSQLDVDDLALTTSTGTRLAANGSLGGSTPLTLPFRLADLSTISPLLTGAAEGQLTLTGGLGSAGIKLDATVAEGSISGQPVKDLAIGYDGSFAGGALDGDATAEGTVAGVPVTARAHLAGPIAGLAISDIEAKAASATATGALTLGGALPSGSLRVAAPDIGPLAALAGVEASGALTADISLPAAGSNTAPRIEADIRNLRYGDIAIDALSITSRNADPTALAFAADVEGRGVSIGGTAVDRVTGTVSGTPERLATSLSFAVAGGSADVSAEVALGAGPLAITVTALRFAKDGEAVTLAGPATIRVVDGTARFDRLELASAGGSAVVSGSVGERLDLDATVSGLPLSVAALAAPGLDLSGTVNGTLALSGTASAPTGRYDLRIGGFSMAALRDAAVGTLDIAATGTVTPDSVTARGRVGGPAGSAVNFDGTVPLNGGPIAVSINGSADLGALDRALDLTPAELAGTVSVDGRIAGPLSQPGFRGTVSIADGSYVDRIAGVSFTGISGRAEADGQRITISSLTGRGTGNGTISASGTVDLGAGGGPTGDITLRAENARVLESRQITLDVDGSVHITGPLLSQPTISGTVTVERLEVNLASSMPAALQPLDVSHRNAPPGLQRPDTGGSSGATAGGGSGAFNARLDLDLAAPGRVFIRGQGLDAELEGTIHLAGTLSNPVTAGAFHLRRGSYTVLSQRLSLTQADLTFVGDTDPAIDIVAETSAGDVTAMFTISGTASEPQFSISSSPELPQDEVLSRLLFNRATEDLTAGQAIQLAQAIGQLAGADAGPGLLEDLRAKTGLDELSFSTDTNGNLVLNAGRYIGDRLYVGVEQGSGTDSTRATVDLDITGEISARGEIGANGSSRVGITIEHDY